MFCTRSSAAEGGSGNPRDRGLPTQCQAYCITISRESKSGVLPTGVPGSRAMRPWQQLCQLNRTLWSPIQVDDEGHMVAPTRSDPFPEVAELHVANAMQLFSVHQDIVDVPSEFSAPLIEERGPAFLTHLDVEEVVVETNESEPFPCS